MASVPPNGPSEADQPKEVAVRVPFLHWKFIVQVLVIAGAVWWIYWPVRHGGWLWDDDFYVTANPLLHAPDRLWKAWFVPGSFVEYYPIEETVQWVQWRLWGMKTLGYHLTNIVLHFCSALLVWRLLSKFGLRLAWMGGLIFAIHPAQVESVAWIVELKNTLSLPPFLLAMCAWVDYEEHQRGRDYELALWLFLAAMLCKITMAMFPVVILLFAWWKRGRIGWSDLKASVPFWLISLVLGITAIAIGQNYDQQSHGEAADEALGGIFSRMACGGLSLSFYFLKCVVPVWLMPVYPQWVVNPPSLWQFLPWPVFGIVLYWLWTRRSSWGRHALLGLGFFAIFLAPFLGFIAISYMTFSWVMDHFLYLPIIGLIGLVVAALEQVPASFRFYGCGLTALALALMAFESRSYAKKFIDSEALWTYQLQCNPEAYPAHNNLGKVLLEQGSYAEAGEEFEETVRLHPHYAPGHNNLGNALQATGRMPDAIAQYQQALQLKPNYAEAHYNLGLALQKTGRLADAMEQYQQALQFNPGSADAHNNLGNVFLQTGRLAEARDQFEQALQIKPDFADAYYNLGDTLLQSGRFPEAMEQFEKALQIKPDLAKAHNNLGGCLMQSGWIAEATEQYEEALQIDPGYAMAHNNLGLALQKAGRLSEARQQYEEALRIDSTLTAARNNLAQLLALQKTVQPKP